MNELRPDSAAEEIHSQFTNAKPWWAAPQSSADEIMHGLPGVRNNMYDLQWKSHQGWFDRLVLTVFRKTINRFIHHVISEAHSRSQINSYQMHNILGISNRILGE